MEERGCEKWIYDLWDSIYPISPRLLNSMEMKGYVIPQFILSYCQLVSGEVIYSFFLSKTNIFIDVD